MGEVIETKAYLLDTNVFRYKSNPSAHKIHKKAGKRFWKNVLQEVRNGEASLFIPREVVRELEIQSYTLSEKENQRIADLLEQIEVTIPDIATPEIEHHIRKMAAYIRSEYKNEIHTVKDMEYGGVSDARILFAAWQYDCILVTSNIKDFMLYPLLFPQNENRLFNLLSEMYVTNNPSVYEKIHKDPTFKGMMQVLHKMIEGN
jgi:predicted nucleic acid-binding protein